MEPAGATGPPRPAPAVQRNEASCGGCEASAHITNRSLVVGRPAAGRGLRLAIDPARTRQRGAAGAVGTGGRGRREGHEATGAKVLHGVREPRARPGALRGAGRTAPSQRIVNSGVMALSAKSRRMLGGIEDEGGGYKTVSFFSIWWACARARTNSVMSYVCSLIPTNFSWNSGTCFPCCRKISKSSVLQIFLQHRCTWYKTHEFQRRALQHGCVVKKSATRLRCRPRNLHENSKKLYVNSSTNVHMH